jgi:hypothetical protein
MRLHPFVRISISLDERRRVLDGMAKRAREPIAAQGWDIEG